MSNSDNTTLAFYGGGNGNVGTSGDGGTPGICWPSSKPNKQFRKKSPYVSLTRNSLRYIDLSGEDHDVTHNLTLLDFQPEDGVQAYISTASGYEVEISPVEGAYVVPSFFRVASFPVWSTEDAELVPGLKDHAVQEGRESIWRQEDYRFIQLLDGAIDARDDEEWQGKHRVKMPSVYQIDFDLAKAVIEAAELPVSKLLINPLTLPYFDVKFDVGVWKSVSVPEGRAYLLTASDYLGAFVTLYGIKENVNPTPGEFKEGVVFDEMIALGVLNPDGIVRFEL